MSWKTSAATHLEAFMVVFPVLFELLKVSSNSSSPTPCLTRQGIYVSVLLQLYQKYTCWYLWPWLWDFQCPVSSLTEALKETDSKKPFKCVEMTVSIKQLAFLIWSYGKWRARSEVWLPHHCSGTKWPESYQFLNCRLWSASFVSTHASCVFSYLAWNVGGSKGSVSISVIFQDFMFSFLEILSFQLALQVHEPVSERMLNKPRQRTP